MRDPILFKNIVFQNKHKKYLILVLKVINSEKTNIHNFDFQ